MKTTLTLGLAGAFVIALLVIGPWVWWHRVQDCRSLGHGIAYCIVVWGSR